MTEDNEVEFGRLKVGRRNRVDGEEDKERDGKLSESVVVNEPGEE